MKRIEIDTGPASPFLTHTFDGLELCLFGNDCVHKKKAQKKIHINFITVQHSHWYILHWCGAHLSETCERRVKLTFILLMYLFWYSHSHLVHALCAHYRYFLNSLSPFSKFNSPQNRIKKKKRRKNSPPKLRSEYRILNRMGQLSVSQMQILTSSTLPVSFIPLPFQNRFKFKAAG